ncbi:YggS family pyridoxal phosphate-dependent enzyme [Silvanigrella sp.]|jgi:pyridoxal phosphate enzyme (YggS family)|uniref:YggS family pyridoxal phosphate-dependent enzyme n=1 Tax=Silvanigrella sp. TaxID=2024976 RepID=UPI0037CBD0EE
MSEFLKNNIMDIKNKINLLCIKYKRKPTDIELIAVSKFHEANKIQEAYSNGLTHFGENYIQEWQKKSDFLSPILSDLKWHIIGHIQNNKAKFINDKVHCLQSLDSLSLAKEIEKKSQLDLKLNILIQLQIDMNDLNKSGIQIEKTNELLDFISQSKKLSLKGFMGIGPAEIDYLKRKDLYFNFVENSNKLWNLYYNNPINQKPIISLGMSSDYELAIECGSTMLRMGTAIFGDRIKS